MFNRGFVSLFSASIAAALALISVAVIILTGAFGVEIDSAMRAIVTPVLIVAAALAAGTFIVLGMAPAGDHAYKDRMRVFGSGMAIVLVTLLMLVPGDEAPTFGGFVVKGVVSLVAPFFAMFVIPQQWLPVHKRWVFLLSVGMPIVGTTAAWELGFRSLWGSSGIAGSGSVIGLVILSFLASSWFASFDPVDEDDVFA